MPQPEDESPDVHVPGSMNEDLHISGDMESLNHSALKSAVEAEKPEEPLAIKKQTTSQEDELRKMVTQKKKESDIQAM